MKFYKLILTEKKGEFYFEETREKFIKAKNRDLAYNKALKIAATFGKPDKEMIFWIRNRDSAVWIKSLEEISMI